MSQDPASEFIDAVSCKDMEIVVTNMEYLRQKSEPVANVAEATPIMARLEKFQSLHPNCIGISAPQLGILKQVVFIRTPNQVIKLVNPRIVGQSDEMVYFKEGCMSFPGKSVHTKRHAWVLVEDICSEVHRFEGLESICVQHEVDHLQGVLFMDREVVLTVRNDGKIPGRNESCPCGSGKKYKKCCLNR